MLGSEVSPQVHNLPSSQTDQHTHRAEREPLHSLVGALVGVAETLLAGSEVIHLGDDVSDHLLETSKICFHRLELLLRLDAGPVTGVGANFNIEIDFTVGIGNVV